MPVQKAQLSFQDPKSRVMSKCPDIKNSPLSSLIISSTCSNTF